MATNYLSNANLLTEIAKSKLSFCSYVDASHGAYDAFAKTVSDITPDFVREVRAKKARPRGGEKVDPESIDPASIVFRVMTFDHVPMDADRVRPARGDGAGHAKTNFPPFSHYILTGDGPKEVLRSHWKGGIENGHFSASHGRVTNGLAKAWMLLVDRYGRRPNYANYTYLDEMKANALVQLSQVGLQFNESKQAIPNPFAYYTTITRNSFLRILNEERKSRDIRDDMLEMASLKPSFSRQNANMDGDRL